MTTVMRHIPPDGVQHEQDAWADFQDCLQCCNRQLEVKQMARLSGGPFVLLPFKAGGGAHHGSMRWGFHVRAGREVERPGGRSLVSSG